MRKILIIAAVILSATVSAEEFERKNWSFYGNVGIGSQSNVSLNGLQLSDADREYFNKRGITKLDFETTGKSQVVPSFKIGASYYFSLFRASLDLGSQYVKQTNYHATNFNMDALFGISPLKGNHELNIDIGVGYYALWNDYYYNWNGLNSITGEVIYNPETKQPETKSCYLGNHDTHCVSIPLKLSYLYNISGRHWLGAYLQGRYNCGVNEAFCPKYVYSGGIEYRYTLGRKRVKKEKPAEVAPVFVPAPAPAQPTPQPAPAQPAPCNCCSPMPMPCMPSSNCGGNGKRAPHTYVYNPVYSPVYVIVTPDSNVKVETPDGTIKVEAGNNGAKGDNCGCKNEASAKKDNCPCNDGTIRILFEIGSAVITETSDSILKKIDLDGVENIEITASTCARGSDEVNEKLGRNRLEAVKKYLRGRGYTGKFSETYSINEAPDPDWRSVFIRIVNK